MPNTATYQQRCRLQMHNSAATPRHPFNIFNTATKVPISRQCWGRFSAFYGFPIFSILHTALLSGWKTKIPFLSEHLQTHFKRRMCLLAHMRARNSTKTSSLAAKNLLGKHYVLVWPLGVQSSATEHHFLDIARTVPGSFKRNAEACVSFCGKLPRAVAVAIRRAMRTVCPAMWQKSLSEWP